MKLVGADADLGAEAELLAVHKPGGSIDQHGGCVDLGHEPLVDHRSTRTQRGDLSGGQDAFLGECLGSEDLDFEHGVEAVDVSKERGDVGW